MHISIHPIQLSDTCMGQVLLCLLYRSGNRKARCLAQCYSLPISWCLQNVNLAHYNIIHFLSIALLQCYILKSHSSIDYYLLTATWRSSWSTALTGSSWHMYEQSTCELEQAQNSLRGSPLILHTSNHRPNKLKWLVTHLTSNKGEYGIQLHT